MLTPRILQKARERWIGWIAARAEVTEPLDHPSILGMNLRELADLPLERWECGENTPEAHSLARGWRMMEKRQSWEAEGRSPFRPRPLLET